MWPDERTAILVIHGVGQQDAFETLDRLVRGFKVSLEEQKNPFQVTLSHRLQRMDSKNGPQSVSCISLAPSGGDAPPGALPIDCYEYYWAHETQRQIEFDEVVDWAIATGSAARTFYDENNELVDEYESTGVDAFKGKSFPKYWYLKQLGFAFWAIRWVLPLAGVIMSALPDRLKSLIRVPLRLFGRVTKSFLVDYAGDVAIYVSSDMKSEFYKTRQDILNGAVEKLSWLLRSENPKYERIILMGHSLGSVIAYDTLNRVNNQMNLDPEFATMSGKLRGLVTFGSPLDKIAFFFRERAKRGHYVRRQMLDHYHGFKSKNFNLGKASAPTVRNEIESLLDNHVRWLNFWDARDPIAGHLDFYRVDVNHQMHFDLDGGFGKDRIAAHSEYWNPGPHNDMYDKIINELLGPGA